MDAVDLIEALYANWDRQRRGTYYTTPEGYTHCYVAPAASFSLKISYSNAYMTPVLMKMGYSYLKELKEKKKTKNKDGKELKVEYTTGYILQFWAGEGRSRIPPDANGICIVYLVGRLLIMNSTNRSFDRSD